MRDEDNRFVGVIVFFESSSAVFGNAVCHFAAEFFGVFHVSVQNLDFGADFKKVCAEKRKPRASAAFVKVIETFDDKACLNGGNTLFNEFDYFCGVVHRFRKLLCVNGFE